MTGPPDPWQDGWFRIDYVRKADLTEAVQEILNSYFRSLEDGEIETIRPNPLHKWRYWKKGLSVEEARERLADADEYMSAGSQHSWANTHHGKGQDFEVGPDLSRLPDDAVLAMFQEIDTAAAKIVKDESGTTRSEG